MATEKEKVSAAANAPKSTLDPKLREAALAGGGESTEGWREEGAKFLYKPEHFVTYRENGVEGCFRVGPDGKKHPTAPAVTGIPYGVIDRKGDQGDYQQVAVLLTKPTFLFTGEGAAKVEQAVAVGQTVLFTVTAALEPLVVFANDPKAGTEVEVRPLQKRPLGKGKDIWDWSIKTNPIKRERVMLSANELPPQLQD